MARKRKLSHRTGFRLIVATNPAETSSRPFLFLHILFFVRLLTA